MSTGETGRTPGRFIGRAWAFLTSRKGSHWLLGAMIALLVVWLAPFQLTGQPSATIEAIAWTWWPFVIAYALIGIATLVCTYTRARTDIGRARIDAAPQGDPTEGAEKAAMPFGRVLGLLRGRGYSVVEGEHSARAVRRAWAPLGGSVFHIGILVFAGGLILNAATTQVVSFRVVEGQTFAQGLAAVDETGSAGPAGLVASYTLARVQPDYYKDFLLFSRLDATLNAVDGTSRTFALARPLWLDPITLLSIQDYGLAPRFSVKRLDASIEESAVVAMNVFPPGTEDQADFLTTGARLKARVYPDYGEVNGKPVSLSYNIRNPKLLLAISSAAEPGKLLGRGLVGEGESIDAGSLRVTSLGVLRYGTFKITRSPGSPVVALGFLMMAFGLVARIAGQRIDVRLWDAGDGVYFDAHADMYGRDRGRRVIREMLGSDEEPAR